MTKDTETFPIEFTTVYGIVASVSAASGLSSYPIPSRFPHTITNSGFSHTKVSSGSGTIYYIAFGKLN